MTTRNKTHQTASTTLSVGSVVWVTDENDARPNAETGQARVLAIDAANNTVDVEFFGFSLSSDPVASKSRILSGVPKEDLRTPNAFMTFD